MLDTRIWATTVRGTPTTEVEKAYRRECRLTRDSACLRKILDKQCHGDSFTRSSDLVVRNSSQSNPRHFVEAVESYLESNQHIKRILVSGERADELAFELTPVANAAHLDGVIPVTGNDDTFELCLASRAQHLLVDTQKDANSRAAYALATHRKDVSQLKGLACHEIRPFHPSDAEWEEEDWKMTVATLIFTTVSLLLMRKQKKAIASRGASSHYLTGNNPRPLFYLIDTLAPALIFVLGMLVTFLYPLTTVRTDRDLRNGINGAFMCERLKDVDLTIFLSNCILSILGGAMWLQRLRGGKLYHLDLALLLMVFAGASALKIRVLVGYMGHTLVAVFLGMFMMLFVWRLTPPEKRFPVVAGISGPFLLIVLLVGGLVSLRRYASRSTPGEGQLLIRKIGNLESGNFLDVILYRAYLYSQMWTIAMTCLWVLWLTLRST